MRSCRILLLSGWIVTLLVLTAGSAPAADQRFELRYEASLFPGPYTGRVYLFFSRHPQTEPREGPHWFHPEPFVVRDVVDWKAGDVLVIDGRDPKVFGYPQPLAKLDLQEYRVQGVARFNPWTCRIGKGAGNGYSAAVPVPGNASATVPLLLSQRVTEPPLRENHWQRLLQIRSPLLSRFHRREVSLRGAVLLPASYHDQPDRKYPVVYVIPGFGGTHRFDQREEPFADKNAGNVEFIRVTLDPEGPLGHHVFADSANNGPVGQALVEEFIPAFERQYRAVASSRGRFLTGHSSGGWSSLWLQVTYPDLFGGTWSTAPDPVDFRDFQQINLYRPGENMYRDPQGNRRPLARHDGQVLLWYDSFDRMETLLGYGGQLHSFEAVFSPRGADGRPVRLWNRETGAIDSAVAKTWEQYDIRLNLERKWPELGPKLQGKLHVFMGEADTFYLEGATRLLKESLERLGSDAVVELVPGKDHRTLLSSELRQRIKAEMVASFLRK